MQALENLFKWKGELTIKDRKGEPVLEKDKPLVVYQRVIGDADLAKARKEALKASRKLRQTLRETEERATFISEFGALPDDTLRNMIVIAEGATLRSQAIDTAEKPKEPKRPDSKATLEEQEEYENALEQFSKERDELVKKQVGVIIDTRLKELKKLNTEELANILVDSTINSLCRAEMIKVFNSWCTYMGTYSDKRMNKRAFTGYASFDNAATELKEQLIGGYLRLEMSGEDLKN